MRLLTIICLLSAILPFSACSQTPKSKPESAKKAVYVPKREGHAVATFAGGCFWCTEGVLERLRGVEEAVSGYTGGHTKNPTYEEISEGNTGHAEAVQILYDPKLITYKQLLEAFFATHDPTTLNRQGPDVGTQYRSAIFYRTKEEEQLARQVMEEVVRTGKVKVPIVTEVVPFKEFFEAEEYHQNYYNRNPNQPYIRAVARPKVEKLEKEFKDQLKK
jgi:peptide-methionine (S)-S-oxide reductase